MDQFSSLRSVAKLLKNIDFSGKKWRNHTQDSKIMKRTLVPLLLCFAASTLSFAAEQPSTLTQAQKAYISGDIATAKALFEKVLKDDPQNPAARNYLKNILAAEAEIPVSAKVEKQLQSLILPKVEFKDATLDSVLEALKQQASKASAGKTVVNFVVQPGVNVSTPVTLHLTDIPFREAIKYVGDLVGADIVFDRYAILVKPKATATPATEATPAP